eukprot:13132867-Alexandrium_andersonii.AAC.1
MEARAALLLTICACWGPAAVSMFGSRHSRLHIDKHWGRSEARRAGKGLFGGAVALTIHGLR